MLLGTVIFAWGGATVLVSIPREDSCFWELPRPYNFPDFDLVSIPREDSCFWEPVRYALSVPSICFNPQRGFMLLGTLTDTYQQNRGSGFNPQRGFMLLGTRRRLSSVKKSPVSIPREDSCFWEHETATGTGIVLYGFNPQRGFMLLGTDYVDWRMLGI